MLTSRRGLAADAGAVDAARARSPRPSIRPASPSHSSPGGRSAPSSSAFDRPRVRQASRPSSRIARRLRGRRGSAARRLANTGSCWDSGRPSPARDSCGRRARRPMRFRSHRRIAKRGQRQRGINDFCHPRRGGGVVPDVCAKQVGLGRRRLLAHREHGCMRLRGGSDRGRDREGLESLAEGRDAAGPVLRGCGLMAGECYRSAEGTKRDLNGLATIEGGVECRRRPAGGAWASRASGVRLR